MVALALVIALVLRTSINGLAAMLAVVVISVSSRQLAAGWTFTSRTPGSGVNWKCDSRWS